MFLMIRATVLTKIIEQALDPLEQFVLPEDQHNAPIQVKLVFLYFVCYFCAFLLSVNVEQRLHILLCMRNTKVGVVYIFGYDLNENLPHAWFSLGKA